MADLPGTIRRGLLPCLFCGGAPVLFASSDHSTAWEGGCGNEACRVQPHVWEMDEAKAVAAWNTRPDRIGSEGWTRLAESLRELGESDDRIRELSRRFGLDANGVQPPAELFAVVEVTHRGLTLVTLRTDEQPLPFTEGQRVQVTTDGVKGTDHG